MSGRQVIKTTSGNFGTCGALSQVVRRDLKTIWMRLLCAEPNLGLQRPYNPTRETSTKAYQGSALYFMRLQFICIAIFISIY